MFIVFYKYANPPGLKGLIRSKNSRIDAGGIIYLQKLVARNTIRLQPESYLFVMFIVFYKYANPPGLKGHIRSKNSRIDAGGIINLQKLVARNTMRLRPESYLFVMCFVFYKYANPPGLKGHIRSKNSRIDAGGIINL